MSIEADIHNVEYIQRSLLEVVDENTLQNMYILDGVSTLEDIQSILSSIVTNLKTDLAMRSDIVNHMKEATTEQMGVYASAWKYGPLIDRELSHRFFSLLENEL